MTFGTLGGAALRAGGGCWHCPGVLRAGYVAFMAPARRGGLELDNDVPENWGGLVARDRCIQRWLFVQHRHHAHVPGTKVWDTSVSCPGWPRAALPALSMVRHVQCTRCPVRLQNSAARPSPGSLCSQPGACKLPCWSILAPTPSLVRVLGTCGAGGDAGVAGWEHAAKDGAHGRKRAVVAIPRGAGGLHHPPGAQQLPE